MAVYYKFKSAKDYNSILLDGPFISVADLKQRIVESKYLASTGTDFDLVISNAQTNEEYQDDAAMIPKNTWTLIRRIPGWPRKPIVVEQQQQRDKEKDVENNKVEHMPSASGILITDSSAVKSHEEFEWSDFGDDLYAVPHDDVPVQKGNPVSEISPKDDIDEEDRKIKALVETPALDWQWPCQTSKDARCLGGVGKRMGGRMMDTHGIGQRILKCKTPNPGYICHRCKVPGHFIQHCPTNGDPEFDIKRLKPPAGIPKSMLVANSDGSYVLPNGAAAILKPNEAAFEKEIEGIPSTCPVSDDLPPELHCPLCKEVIRDAVFTSKCCFSSFCDKCIRDHILSKSMCFCGARNILADDLLPNKTVRETISSILMSKSNSCSSGSAGSSVQKRDMESARHVQPKSPSPPGSAASKGEQQNRVSIEEEDSQIVKECEATKKEKTDNASSHCGGKNALGNVDSFEDVPVVSAKEKEQKSQKNPPDVQEKQTDGKKKKRKMHLSACAAADLQLRASQVVDAENYTGIPFAAPIYNSYWSAGLLTWGNDGFATPFTSSMSSAGYASGPFDDAVAGNQSWHPFGVQQGYPYFPQRDDHFELGGVAGMSMNHGSPVVNQEFKAKNPNLRRKREFILLNERDRSISWGEKRNRRDGSPMKSNPAVASRVSLTNGSSTNTKRKPSKVVSHVSLTNGSSSTNTKRKPSEVPTGLKKKKKNELAPIRVEKRRIAAYDDEDSSEETPHFKRRRRLA